MIKINKPMPQCCDDCFAFDDNGDYPHCWISHCSAGYNFDSMHRRMNNCPLIEENEPYAEITMKPTMNISRYYAHNTVMSTSTFLCPNCYGQIEWHVSHCPYCRIKLNWDALTVSN